VLPGRVCGASIAGCGLEAGVCGRLRFASQSCAVDVGRLLASMLKSMLCVIARIAVDSGNISTSDLDLCVGLVGSAATREVSSRIGDCIARRTISLQRGAEEFGRWHFELGRLYLLRNITFGHVTVL
jgi:hypothetical protein